MRTQLCKEGADVSLYRLFDQLNMAGHPTERVLSSLSFDVSQRCSVVSTSRKIEIYPRPPSALSTSAANQQHEKGPIRHWEYYQQVLLILMQQI
jgi:hypothetical protein